MAGAGIVRWVTGAARAAVLPALFGGSLIAALGCSPSPGAGVGADRSRLVAAVGERRMLRGRATGGFRFGPEPSRTRGPSNRGDTPFEVLRVAAEIRKQFDAGPSPTIAGDLSLAYLLTGDWERGTKLAEIRALEDPGADALTDLSAAYLERAIGETRPDDFARAYDAALRALRIEPGQPEAMFDRAMAADGLGLAWLARQAWDDYLAAETEGSWVNLARQARSAAALREAENDRAARERPLIFEAWAAGRTDSVRAIAARRPDLAREILRREALPQAARDIVEGRPAGPGFALARELNEIAEATDRDAMDREALIVMERGDRELAAAHVEFANASQALDDRRVEAGSPGVLHAAEVFKRQGSPYAAQGELQMALVDFFHGRRDGLIGRYGRLIASQQGRYPLLRARAHWMRALCHSFVAADGWQALLDQQEALAILTDARQADPARQMGSQLWPSLNRLGRETEAARVLASILSSLSLEDTPLRTFSVIETLTDDLRAKGLAVAALEIRRSAERGIGRGGPVLRVNAAMGVIELAAELNEGAALARSLESSARSLGQIDDREIRSEMEIVHDLAALEASLLAEPAASADAENLVLRLRERKNQTYLQRALTLLGEKRRAEGRPDLGERALREALSIHLAQRARTLGEFEKIKEFEEAERPADDLVDLLSSTARPEQALTLVEQLRNPDQRVAPALARLRQDLSRDEALVSFWMLRDRVMVDVVTADGVRQLALPLGRVPLRGLIQRLNASIDVESEGLAARSIAELHRALVAPVLPALGSARRIVIVPDRELWQVPFAGLAAGAGEEPLAVRFEIVFASSLFELTRPRQPWSRPRSILTVGNPLRDPSRFPDLAALPESASEARGVAALYPTSRVLVGDEATRSAVQRWAPRFEVVHVAAHAVSNEREPGESFLLLSADGSDPGTWRARDPGWDSLKGVRLVVLSACRTGNQHARFGGASFGVLRSIQSATSAPVLASTGDVEDAASRRLLVAFHRRLAAGETPAAALRLAQLEARRERSGMTWMLYRIVT